MMDAAGGSIVTDAKVTAYLRRYHGGRSPVSLLATIVIRFGADTGWTEERVAEVLDLFEAGRTAKALTAKQAKARDEEVKSLISEAAARRVRAADVRAEIVTRFGEDRAPAVSTITALIAEARRKAGLPPKRSQRTVSR